MARPYVARVACPRRHRGDASLGSQSPVRLTGPRSRSKRGRRGGARAAGFTLLEVLVALAVFALAAVMLASAYLNVLNAYAAANRTALRDDNVRFARAFLLAEPDRRKAEEGDSFEGTGGVRVVWRATIEPTSTADLFHVEFVCEVNEPNSTERRPPVTEQFMLLRPTWSEGIDTAKLRADAKERILELRAKLK